MKSYHQWSGLAYRRGFRAALICGAIGFLVPIFVGLVYTVFRWWISRSSDFDRSYDLRWLPTYLIDPAIGCTILLGSTGWATFAPRNRDLSPQYRFAGTLVAITILTIPAWLALGAILEALGLRSPRVKGIDTPHVNAIIRLALFLAMPILIAISMSILRGFSRSRHFVKAKVFDDF